MAVFEAILGYLMNFSSAWEYKVSHNLKTNK